jgi:hypothetical protein
MGRTGLFIGGAKDCGKRAARPAFPRILPLVAPDKPFRKVRFLCEQSNKSQATENERAVVSRVLLTCV